MKCLIWSEEDTLGQQVQVHNGITSETWETRSAMLLWEKHTMHNENTLDLLPCSPIWSDGHTVQLKNNVIISHQRNRIIDSLL